VSSDQIILFAILGLVFAFLIWGRWRYDLVAFVALVVALIAGVVPTEEAFSGFGHPATVIIALVLVVSRGLSNSGVIEWIGERVAGGARSLSAHIGLMAGVAALLSAVMNNVAALALLMPVDIDAAAKAKRSAALTLMPLSFATILGGLVTLIGTPPNIIIAAFRERALGQSFAMFDFAPVGLACAAAGVAYVALVGWRLIPKERERRGSVTESFELSDYVAELKVPEDGKTVGRTMAEIEAEGEDGEVQMVRLIRGGRPMPGFARRWKLEAGDVLVVQGGPEAIEKTAGALGLVTVEAEQGKGVLPGEDLGLVEVVVPMGAAIEGRTAMSLRLLRRFGVTLLGLSRQGERFRQRVRRVPIRAGDVLLLLGPAEAAAEAVQALGCLPLAERGLAVVQRDKAGIAIVSFAAAIALASFGVLYLPVALAAVAAIYVATGIVPLRQLYGSVEWSVIVLLGSMIPIGTALESSGGTALIAGAIVDLAVGQSAVVVLVLLMVVTMTLSDVMNNTATAVIAAPIAVDVANGLDASADPFLMTVAVAASCAFLTPIGHKNNTLVMGPGGYKFGDYWRMGLPLELLVIAVAIPMILWVWPLQA
jgi:di/tricarboxylate transporter